MLQKKHGNSATKVEKNYKKNWNSTIKHTRNIRIQPSNMKITEHEILSIKKINYGNVIIKHVRNIRIQDKQFIEHGILIMKHGNMKIQLLNMMAWNCKTWTFKHETYNM